MSRFLKDFFETTVIYARFFLELMFTKAELCGIKVCQYYSYTNAVVHQRNGTAVLINSCSSEGQTIRFALSSTPSRFTGRGWGMGPYLK